jgi:hypothetical protein
MSKPLLKYFLIRAYILFRITKKVLLSTSYDKILQKYFV